MNPASHHLAMMDIFVPHAQICTCPRCRAVFAQIMFLADMLEAARRRHAMVGQAALEGRTLRNYRVPLLQAMDQSTRNLRQYLEMEAASLAPIYQGTVDCLEQDVDHAGGANGSRGK